MALRMMTRTFYCIYLIWTSAVLFGFMALSVRAIDANHRHNHVGASAFRFTHINHEQPDYHRVRSHFKKLFTHLHPATQRTIEASPEILKSTMQSLPFHDDRLKRVVKEFEPEGIHLTYLGPDRMLVSWQTGESRECPASSHDPVPEYDPHSVEATVQFSPTDPNLHSSDTQTVTGGPAKGSYSSHHSLVYTYKYGPEHGDILYRSPILHHVELSGLAPGRQYHYRVGGEAHGWSAVHSFRQPPSSSSPIRIAIVGDLGQSINSTNTINSLISQDADAIIFLGDFGYADQHLPNSGDSGEAAFSFKHPDIKPPYSDQRRWDTFARLMEPLNAKTPMVAVMGNHDVEIQPDLGGLTFASANARYPQPVEEGLYAATQPNDSTLYLDPKLHQRFVRDASSVSVNNSYWGVDIGPVHVIGLNSYVPWGIDSMQYAWFRDHIHRRFDRSRTPWLVVAIHSPIYHTFEMHFRSFDSFGELYEPLFLKYGVDLVLNGHVHAYERTRRLFKYHLDECGPVHIVCGDGGNVEGLARKFIDHSQPEFCRDTSKFKSHSQPIPYDAEIVPPSAPFDNGKHFCPSKQPEWSAFREQAFGHGVLEVIDHTSLSWTWYQTTPDSHHAIDRVIIQKSSSCAHSKFGSPYHSDSYGNHDQHRSTHEVVREREYAHHRHEHREELLSERP